MTRAVATTERRPTGLPGKPGLICLVSLVLVALTLRVGASWWWQHRLGDQPFAFGDSDSYWHLARDLAHGEPYAYGTRLRVFRAPGYPLLLAPLFWLADTPPVLLARCLNSVLGVAAVLLCIPLTRQLLRDEPELSAAPCWSGWIATLYPGAIAMSVFVLSEAPFAPCLLWQLYCHQRLMAGGGSRWALMVGAVGGLAVLIRPSWLLFTPGVALLELLRTRLSARTWLHCALMGVAMCLVMSPWWIRNYRVTGRFVPTTLQIGASLMDGWSPQADGSSNMDFVDREAALFKEEYRREGRDMADFEVRFNQRLRDKAVAWAREHPGEAARLGAVKLARMWSPWPDSKKFGGAKMKLIVACGYVPLAALIVTGMWRLRRSWPAWALALPAFYLTSLHVVFVSSIRYRQPAMLALAPVAAVGWVTLLRHLRGRQRPTPSERDGGPA